METRTCALEGCNVEFEKKHKRIYCCPEHAKIANRRQIKERWRKFDPAKKRLENMPSARLAGKLIDCECPICHTQFKDRNCYPVRFCDSCRPVAEHDYSNGFGLKYDPRTDKIQDFL